MKKYMKIIYVLLIVIISIFALSSQVYAAKCPACGGMGFSGGSACTTCDGIGTVSAESDFITQGKRATSPFTTSELQDLSNTVYNMALAVGVVAAFIVGGILGIKYMTGGIEGQAEVKSMLLPYVVGCVVVFGAFIIWKIVVTILQ